MSRKYPVLIREESASVQKDQGKLYPGQQAKRRRRRGRRCLGLTRQRDAGIGDGVRRPEESQTHDPGPAVPRSGAGAYLCPRLNGFANAGTSRQSNTHSTESREIRYPWHPWYGRPVWIHRAFIKAGQAVYRCSLEQNLEGPLLEIPQWMLDSGDCCRVHGAENPAVDCAALQDLKLLLQRARSHARDLVVQAQHPSAPGGADARIIESTEGSSNRIALRYLQ
jgi:hypothetical protein